MKTKSILLALPLMLVMALCAKAQPISGGLVGELSTASVKITGIPNQTYNVIKGDGITGFSVGGYVKAKGGPLFVKASLLINYQAGSVVASSADGSSSNISFSAGKVEVPLMVGLHILGPLYIDAGPEFNQLFYVTRVYNGSDVDVQRSGLGYRVGAGVNISRVSIDVAYEGLRTSSSGSLSSYQQPDEIVLGLSVNLANVK